MKRFFILLIQLILISVHAAFGQDSIQKKWELDFTSEVEIENQFFVNKGLYPNQKDYFLSGALKPKLDIKSEDGKHSFKFELFAR